MLSENGKKQKQDRNVPQLRFAGFTGEWEQRKLGDLYKRNSERNEKQFSETKTISIATMHFNKNGNGASEDSLLNYKVLRIGDIAYEGHTNKQFAFGRFVLNDIGDGIMSPRFMTLRPIKKMDTDFWKHYIHYEPLMRRILVKSTKAGTMMNELVVPEFLNEEILIPKKEEQAKIGVFFKKLEHLIILQQCKLDLLKQKKKGYLQKMFPKENENVPELRFSGYADAWEQRKLGEIGQTYSGLSGKTKEDFGHGNGMFVTYMNVFSNPIADSNQMENVEVDKKQNQVQTGDVFFTTSSETPEEVGMSSVWLGKESNVYLNSFCFGYRPTHKFNSYYLAFMLRSPLIRSKFMILAQGISRYNISKKKVMEMDILFPELSEQKQIGCFFERLDHLITLHQRKLDMLKERKKAYLQKMFI